MEEEDEETKIDTPSLFWSKAWYFTSFSASACLVPLLNLYFRRTGLSEAQIGVITAMRPWTSAVAGNLWASLGDQTGAYKTILILAHICAVTSRYCIGLAGSFPLTLTLVIVTEAMTAPLQIMADASTMAVGREADYGKARLWGAVGWGAFSPVSGLIVSKFGERAAFNANLLGGILGLLPTIFLPTHALRQRQLEKMRRSRQPVTSADAVSQQEAYQIEASPKGNIASSHTCSEGTEDHFDTPGSSPRFRNKVGGTSPSTSSRSEAYDSPWDLEEQYEDVQGRSHLVHTGPESDASLSGVGHEDRDFAPKHAGRGMKRGDSLLYDVAICLPAAPAPDFMDYECAIDHSELYRHPHRDGLERHSAKPMIEHAASEANSMEQELQRMSEWQKLKLLFSDPELVVFLGMAVLFGFATGTIDGYLFLYLDTLGGPEVLMGLTITVSCLMELFIFYYMGPILQFVGVQPMLHWVMFIFLVRLACYSLLAVAPSPWMVLPVETLNAITFGCAWAAGTVQCSRSAPPGLEATTQSIYAGLYAGLGRGLGGLFGGLIYNRYGPRSTFMATFLVMCGGWLSCATAQQVIRCCAKAEQDSQQEAPETRPLLHNDY